jgi:hypothetical protein
MDVGGYLAIEEGEVILRHSNDELALVDRNSGLLGGIEAEGKAESKAESEDAQ